MNNRNLQRRASPGQTLKPLHGEQAGEVIQTYFFLYRR